MNCSLTVHAGDGTHQWNVDEWTALVVLASLSAEPETLEELENALCRYLPQQRLLESGHRVERWDQAASTEGPWCLVDLAGRTVMSGGDFDLPDPREAYQADDEDQVEGFPIVWLDTPDDWAFREAGDDWQQVVARRAATRRPRLDARGVLYGRPLLEHLAGGVLAEIAGHEQPSEEQRWQLTRQIHAAWLMTPREDLRARTPRELLLAERNRITLDLEHRSHQWSQQGFAPPPLPADSFAYRFGGFGTTEVVLYFDLVRALLAEAWRQAGARPELPQEALIEALAAHRDQWLAAPCEDGSGPQPTGELIECERRRMPVTSDGSHLDCDCPICQAEASGEFGPMFMWFDGHHLELEDEFAFSMTESREEWEQDQEDYREFSEKMDREMAEREAAKQEDDEFASAWQSSFVSPDAPRGLGSLSIGFRLAELVTDVKQRTRDRAPIEALNEAYRTFHTAQSDIVRQAAAEQLCLELESVAAAYPELVSKSADLQSTLHQVLREGRIEG